MAHSSLSTREKQLVPRGKIRKRTTPLQKDSRMASPDSTTNTGTFCSRCGREGSSTRDCNCPRIPSGENRLYVPVIFGDRHILAVVDTGAVSSLVNEEFAVVCQEAGFLVSEKGYCATLANGTLVFLRKSVTGVAVVNYKKIRHTFLVLDATFPKVILGMDILIRLGLEVSLAGHKLWPYDMCDEDEVDVKVSHKRIKL